MSVIMQVPTGVSFVTDKTGAKVVPNALGRITVAQDDVGFYLMEGCSLITGVETDQEAEIDVLQAAGTLAGTGTLINSATGKTTPIDADYLGLMDSAGTPANILKKLSWANVKATLKTYFDGLYTLAALGGVGHALATAANDFLVASGAGAYVKKTLAETKAILGFTVYDKALSGDLVFVIAPATVASAATAAAWTRTVTITLKTAAAEVHSWFNRAIATGVAIADTSTAGTATIVSTTLTFVAGVATVVISGDAAAWLGTETDTLTVAAATILGHTVAGGTSVETFS